MTLPGSNYARLLGRYLRAERAFAYASRRGLEGQEFGRFGKKLGWSMIRKRQLTGISYVLVPVHITRYFEFAFVQAHRPLAARRCLDLSSPALYSLYLAAKNGRAAVLMANPDGKDVAATEAAARVLKLANLRVENRALHELAAPPGGYECIWSISVLEHIAGDYDDTEAVQMLFDLLGKGGRLILTVPVDRSFWIEYRDVDYYGTQTQAGAPYFFQRFYDWPAIRERLLEPLGCRPSHIGWFGEKVNGRFQAYIRRWQDEGLDCIIEDPREIVDHYQRYESWEEMPGVGVCGLVIDKP